MPVRIAADRWPTASCRATSVVCPLHAYKVCLDTGNVLKPEVCVRVDTFPVRVENGVILVAMDGVEEKAA